MFAIKNIYHGDELVFSYVSRKSSNAKRSNKAINSLAMNTLYTSCTDRDFITLKDNAIASYDETK